MTKKKNNTFKKDQRWNSSVAKTRGIPPEIGTVSTPKLNGLLPPPLSLSSIFPGLQHKQSSKKNQFLETNGSSAEQLQIAPFVFEANTCRAGLADFVTDGVCDRRVIDHLRKENQFLAVECELLDYKEIIPSDAVSIGKLLRHIVAFHNTFGGYLIYGVSEVVSEIDFRMVGCEPENLDLKQLKDKIYSYTGANIQLSSHTVKIEEMHIVLIFIPKRQESEPVYFGKDGPQDLKGNKSVFKKGDFYMRRGDNSEPAAGESIAFLFGPRVCFYKRAYSEKIISDKKFTENNLPERNFICARFVGRISTIEKLWLWFADQFSYVRVLAGEGGLGKTSIAYEFALQVCVQAPIGIQRVLWLTAKKRQFSAESDAYVPVPWTHFDTYNSLLDYLCRESAVSASEIEGADDRLLKVFLKDALVDFPTLVIIDDVDSLTVEDQKRTLELAMQLANTKSRFLLTTRRNLTYSADIAIELEGLKGGEFSDYVGVLQQRYHGPAVTDKELESIQLTTHGSPLFTDSLYRLIRRGSTVKRASEEWRGKKGAQARSAALAVEIESLSDESKRVLLAVSILRSCSLRELAQACQYVDETLNDCLEELSSFYLISAPRIRNEPRYEVLETMYSLVVQIKDSLVPNAEKFEKEVRQLRKAGGVGSGTNESTLVGKAISEASALLRDNEVAEALETIAVAQRRSKYHPDLYLMQANCLMLAEPLRSNEARKALRKAFDGGVRKPLLFDLWFQAEMYENHAVGALTVCDLAISCDVRHNGSWEGNRLKALIRIAKDQERSADVVAAMKNFDLAAEYGFSIINKLPQQEQFSAKESLFELNDLIVKLGRRRPASTLHCLDMVNLIRKMTDRKDFRRITLFNIVEFLEQSGTNSHYLGKFSNEATQLKDQARLHVISVIKKARTVRTEDGQFLDKLLRQAERA